MLDVMLAVEPNVYCIMGLQVIWTARVENSKLVMTYVSADGEENFPGEVTTTVVYELTDTNELKIDYTATTTKPTPVVLTSHGYFNLGGHVSVGLIHV